MQVRKKKGEKGGGANLYTKRVQIEVRKEKNEREREKMVQDRKGCKREICADLNE